MCVQTREEISRPLQEITPGLERAINSIDKNLSGIPQCGRALVGNSYFFVWSDPRGLSLHRLNMAGGRLSFSEIVDHDSCGISDSDIKDAIREDNGVLDVPGYYLPSLMTEKKLRALLEP